MSQFITDEIVEQINKNIKNLFIPNFEQFKKDLINLIIKNKFSEELTIFFSLLAIIFFAIVIMNAIKKIFNLQ